MPNCSGQRGLTLVEVLVALTILSILTLVVVGIFLAEGEAWRRVRERSAVNAYLESQMEWLRALAPLDEGSLGRDLGAEGMAPPGLPEEGTVLVTTVAPWDEGSGMHHVQLRLEWGEEGRRRTARLEALLPVEGVW